MTTIFALCWIACGVAMGAATALRFGRRLPREACQCTYRLPVDVCMKCGGVIPAESEE